MAKLSISRSRVLAVISHAGWKSGDKWDNDRLLSKISQLPEVLDDSKATPKDPQVAKDIASLLKQVLAGGAIEVVDDEPEEPTKTTTKAKSAAAKPAVKTKAKPSADEDDDDGEDSVPILGPEDDDEGDGDDDEDEEDDEDEDDEDDEEDEEDEDEDDEEFDRDEGDAVEEEDDDDDDEAVADADAASKVRPKPKPKVAKGGRSDDEETAMFQRIVSKGGDASPATLPCSIEQTNPEPGVVEIVIRVRTGAAASTLAPIEVEAPETTPPVVAKKVRTVPVDDEGKTLTGAPAKKIVSKGTRWHQAARALKAIGVDSEITDKLVNKVDSAYGRSNPRESRVCLVGAQAAIRSYLGGDVDASLSYSVAGAVVKKYGPQANDEKGHVFFVKLLGKPCETASHYLKNALWVIEAYRTA